MYFVISSRVLELYYSWIGSLIILKIWKCWIDRLLSLTWCFHVKLFLEYWFTGHEQLHVYFWEISQAINRCRSAWKVSFSKSPLLCTITVVMWVLTDIRRRLKALSSSVLKRRIYVHRNQANIYCNILIGELLLFSRRWKSFSQLWQISHRICLKLAACVKNVCSICALKY